MCELIEKLEDQRSKKVMFISHCLLNTNTRYLVGAFRRGSVEEIIYDVLKEGVGIVQMKCPEQWAWGGVLRKILLIVFDAKWTFPRDIKPLLIKLFIAYTRITYKKLANETFKMICDHIKSGYKIMGIIGVDGSSSCGVTTILDIRKVFDYFVCQDIKTLNKDEFNRELYENCTATGRGILCPDLFTKPFFKHHEASFIFARFILAVNTSSMDTNNILFGIRLKCCQGFY